MKNLFEDLPEELTKASFVDYVLGASSIWPVPKNGDKLFVPRRVEEQPAYWFSSAQTEPAFILNDAFQIHHVFCAVIVRLI